MDALPNALAPTSTPLRSVQADSGAEQNGTNDTLPDNSFAEALNEQGATKDNSADTPAKTLPAGRFTGDTLVDSDLPHADVKPDIIPIADINGTERIEADTTAPAVATQPTLSSDPAVTNQPATATRNEQNPDNTLMAADLWVAPGSPTDSATQPGRGAAIAARAPLTGPVTGAATPDAAPQTQADIVTPPAPRTIDAILPSAADPTIDADRPAQQVATTPSGTPAQAPASGSALVAGQIDASAPQQAAQSATLTPITIGVAPADSAESTTRTIQIAKPETTPIADVTGDIEARVATKETVIVSEPGRPAIETLKASDLPTINTLSSVTGDTVSTPKTLPLTPQAPVPTPISGLAERMAANYIQTTPSMAPVTLDKLPQTVVALTLNARSATLQIDPPELGRIQLEYQFDTQGRTVVTLIPESEAARAALIDRMAAISAALSQNASGEVDVRMGDSSDFAFVQDDGTFADGSSDQSGRDTSEAGQSHTQSSQQTTQTQSFTRGSSGQTDRLHILV